MDRERTARICARIEHAGGNVLEYLREAGCVSPWGTWFRLQREELGRAKIQITDGKGRKDMRKLTLEDKKNAVNIAIEGGNPLQYLKEIGCGNPSASWAYIKKNLQIADPEKYERLMDAQAPKEEEEMPEADVVIDAEKIAAREENATAVPVCTAPLSYGGFKVRCIENEWGKFYYDSKFDLLDWTAVSGEEVSFTPEAWCEFIENLQKAMAILGASPKIDKNGDEI